MARALNFLIALASLPLLGAGLGLMLSPEGLFERVGLAPSELLGLSTVRSIVGGFLLSSGLMMVLGLVRRQTQWFVAVATMMGVASVGRVAGLVLDGFTVEAVRPLVVEIVLMVLLFAAHRRRPT